MSENVSERPVEKVSLVDPFCGAVSKKKYIPFQRPDLDYNKKDILGVELDKETGNTKVVVTGTEDIDRQIQECLEDSGFESMKRLIATGQARPLDFADDGKGGKDITNLPDNVNDAYRAALAAKESSDKVNGQFNIKPVYNADGSINMEATEKSINDAVRNMFASVQNKTEVKEDAESK